MGNPLQNDKAVALKAMQVSPEIITGFEVYVNLLIQWSHVKNLVAPSTLSHIWTRHILDSYQLFTHLKGHRVIDLGSGGGLPGVILGILLKNTPNAVVHLVESNQKKCAFLREAVRVTGAKCVVHAKRAEDVVPDFVGKIDTVTARAFTSLTELLDLTQSLLTSGSEGLFLKGAMVQDEILDAKKHFEFSPELLTSLTHDHSAILKIKNLQGKES